MTATKSSMKSLKAYEKIRDMILMGLKLPGTRLVLSELEDELGIGRGPIREAIMRLDRSGLVINIPYKGAVVAVPPTQNEIFHIYDLRVNLEVKLAVEAIPNLTPKKFAELEDLIVSMDKFSRHHYQYDRQFHTVIYEASGMNHLCQIHQVLIFKVESVLNIHQWDKEHCILFNAEHRAILEALKQQDEKMVKETLTTNINSGLKIIKETYNKLPGHSL